MSPRVPPVLLAALLLAVMAAPAPAALRPMAGLSAGLLLPRDDDFRAVYGGRVFLPGFRLGVCLAGNYYAWGAMQLARSRGTTRPVLKLPATVHQRLLSFGFGFRERLGGRLGYKLEAGFCLLHFREEALGQSASGSGGGFCAESGLTWLLGRRLDLELGVAYMGSGDGEAGSALVQGGWRPAVGLLFRW